MAKKITLEILVFLMVVLFLYAGVSKLMDIHFFEVQLIRSPWIGNYNTILAWSLPIFEITISVLLLIGGRLRALALYAFGLSLVVFSTYISVVLISGQKAPCSCGGLIQKLTWPQHIILNVSFVVIAMIAIRLNTKTKKEIELSQPLFT